MQRPLLPLISAFAAGILVGALFNLSVPWCFATAAFLLIAALSIPRMRPWLLLPLLFAAGAANVTWKAAPLHPDDLRHLFGSDPALVTVTGKLARAPDHRVYTNSEGQQHRRSLCVLQAASLRKAGSAPIAACGQILVLTPGDLPGVFRKHQQVQVTGVLSPPPGPLAPGLFDYRAYLRRQNIFFQLRTTGQSDWTLAGPLVKPTIEDRFIAWARDVLTRGMPVHDEPLRLMLSMALGWRAATEPEVYQPFIESGTVHIFAISGLHIALIAAMLTAVLRAVRVPRTLCGLLILPVIWFYTGATGWQASAVRSTVMCSVVLGGWALARPSDLLNSLFAAAGLILAWDPQELFGAGFQLSFCVVLSIAVFLPVFERWRDLWLHHEQLLHPDLVPPWQRRRLQAARWAFNAVAISLAACLGSLPLTAHYFHLCNPITLLANVLIVPLSSAALACALGSFACGTWLPILTENFNHCAWLFMKLMVWLSEFWASIPLGHFYVRPFSPLACVAWYILLAGLAGWTVLPPMRRWLIIGFGALALTASLLSGVVRPQPSLLVLPADGGLVLFSETSHGQTLVDCGRTNSAQRLITPYLHSRGVDRLDKLILTHGDIRHVSGALPIVHDFSPRAICASDVRFRSAAYRRILETLRTNQPPGRVQTLARGHYAAEWEVLHPAAGDRFSAADDGALVLKASIRGTRVLLLSDLGRAGQELLRARTPDLTADIVVTGLPSTAEPLPQWLLDRIKPRLIIVGDSQIPAQEHAKDELLQRLRQSGAAVLSTSRSGAALIRFEHSRWEVETMNSVAEY